MRLSYMTEWTIRAGARGKARMSSLTCWQFIRPRRLRRLSHRRQCFNSSHLSNPNIRPLWVMP